MNKTSIRNPSSRIRTPRGCKGVCVLPWLVALCVVPLFAAAEFDPDSLQCDPTTGLSEPLPLCSQESPCSHQFGPDITTATNRPLCVTLSADRPLFIDYPPLPWVDSHGTLHYACVSRHPDSSVESPRPLVIAFHGGEAGADFVYNYTSLRERGESFDLSGDPLRPGYHLISVQGRNIHFPTGLPPFSREGAHHDFYYRDFSSPSDNPDVQFVDFLIDAMVAKGGVDADRIYLVGHSNGGFMAQAYGMHRHTRATPDGNHIAAVAVFGAADPFNNIHHLQSPSCRLDPYPTSDLPIYIVQRDCDSQNACNMEQNVRFGNSPGYQFRSWIQVLESLVLNPNVSQRLIDSEGYPVGRCAAASSCTPFRGVINHTTWPDGMSDSSGIDWEGGMLIHFNANPHPFASSQP